MKDRPVVALVDLPAFGHPDHLFRENRDQRSTRFNNDEDVGVEKVESSMYRTPCLGGRMCVPAIVVEQETITMNVR